jgi:hypothetical protein
VHEIRTYAAEDIRFGMRYTDAVTTARDGTPVLDLTKIGALEPDVGDREEQVGRSEKKHGNRCRGSSRPPAASIKTIHRRPRRWLVRRHSEGKHAVANPR